VDVFPGAGDEPDYNTVDAALWFVEAWRAYFEASDDREGLSEEFPILVDIVERHLKGTRYGIRVDPGDGLLSAGEPGVQLTWMDAKVGDWVVTPRIGKPVEINALWYNALCTMAGFAEILSRPAALYCDLAERVRTSFARFFDARTGGLYDAIDGPSGNDASGQTSSSPSACHTARSPQSGELGLAPSIPFLWRVRARPAPVPLGEDGAEPRHQ
jgi:4-alpha-glucanotransferase